MLKKNSQNRSLVLKPKLDVWGWAELLGILSALVGMRAWLNVNALVGRGRRPGVGEVGIGEVGIGEVGTR